MSAIFALHNKTTANSCKLVTTKANFVVVERQGHNGQPVEQHEQRRQVLCVEVVVVEKEGEGEQLVGHHLHEPQKEAHSPETTIQVRVEVVDEALNVRSRTDK